MPAAEVLPATPPVQERWEVWVGVAPLVVHAYEMPERRGAVFARWSDPARVGRDRRRKQSLGLRVRDADGRPDPRLAAEAEAAARTLYAELLATFPLAHPPESPLTPAGLPDAASGAASGDESGGARDAGALSVRAGFALALRLPPVGAPPGADGREDSTGDAAGMYARDGRPRRALQRAGARAVAALGGDTRWADLTPPRVAGFWRVAAGRAAAEGGAGASGGPRAGARTGARTAEQMVATLYAVARWLRARGHLPAGVGVAPPGWRARLAAEWAATTGAPVGTPRARHSADEARALFDALPGADPRIRLAVELGAGVAAGQVLRATRADLDLAPRSGAPLGMLRVRGGRTSDRHDRHVALTPAQRAAVDASLAGYLARYEARFRAGLLDDYPLFPGGKLAGGIVGGVARFRWPPLALHPVTALQLFHALEARAGVPSVRDRGWSGLRRPADADAKDGDATGADATGADATDGGGENG